MQQSCNDFVLLAHLSPYPKYPTAASIAISFHLSGPILESTRYYYHCYALADRIPCTVMMLIVNSEIQNNGNNYLSDFTLSNIFAYSVVVCHNGEIFRYRLTKKEIDLNWTEIQMKSLDSYRAMDNVDSHLREVDNIFKAMESRC